MKLKEWIRTKLAQFLHIDDVLEHCCTEVNRLDKRIDSINYPPKIMDNNLSDVKRKLELVQEELDIVKNTLRNVVSVGADVVPANMSKENSWAVVCIEGNCNIVKFIDLKGKDFYYILNVLKQYEGSRMCVDAPPTSMFKKEFKL